MKSPLIDISSTPQRANPNNLPQVVCDSLDATPLEKSTSDKLTLDIIKQVSTSFNDSSYHSTPLLSLKVAPCMSSSTKIENNASLDSDNQVILKPSLPAKLTSSNHSSISETAQPATSASSDDFGNHSVIDTLTRFIVANSEEAYSRYILPACFFITGILLMFYLLHLS